MTTKPWTPTDSRALYNLDYWGEGYFDINEAGELIVLPVADKKISINLHELAQKLKFHGLSLPILVRFSNILQHRVQRLCQAFELAMQHEAYTASYTAVYPIKVNQQQHVIKTLLNSGQGNIGLEAGSKSELMAVLALAPRARDGQQGTVICNGYKDREYIRLALIGQQMGLQPYIVIEKASELALIIEEATNMGITPRLGVRVRLASISAGQWQNTGGEKSKFGLSAEQILKVVERIIQAGLRDSLQLLHFHLGSQVGNIRDIQRGLREAAHFYAELHALDIPIKIVDVGGGLGIDYNGTRSRENYSINYTMQEYVNNIVHELKTICDEKNLPHPNIITESGRAMTAHHAVLITNIIDIEHPPLTGELPVIGEDEPTILQDLQHGLEKLHNASSVEAYHDAVHLLAEAHIMFSHGLLSLTQRAQAEQLYYAICSQVRDKLEVRYHHHRTILDELNEKLTSKYFCNFSLFQSIPDAWAINQLFPIMPLQRLNEEPSYRATLHDLTCDSDGQVKHYIESDGINSSLPIHNMNTEDEYYLGFFLVGAYQEILGDMHNLFGDTYAVNLMVDEQGNYELVEPMQGDTVQDMLRYVHIDVDKLRTTYRRRLNSTENLTDIQRKDYLQELEAGLIGYTYLE